MVEGFLSGALLERPARVLTALAAPRYASHAFQTGNAHHGCLPPARQMESRHELALIQTIAAWHAMTQMYAAHQ